MKTKLLLVALMGLLSFTNVEAAAKKGVEVRITEKASPSDVKRAHEIQARFDEIAAMDVEHMSREEKMALKQEVKSLKKEAKQMDGVYFYFGGVTLVLLIILLIILL